MAWPRGVPRSAETRHKMATTQLARSVRLAEADDLAARLRRIRAWVRALPDCCGQCGAPVPRPPFPLEGGSDAA